MSIVPAHGTIEIGHIWLSPGLQRTPAATEALVLLMRYAMDDLGYRRLEWKCNAANDASRRAALRLGFRFEGVFFNHQVFKGRNRDTAWFSILDEEWPAVRAAYATWLAADNFGRRRGAAAAPERAHVNRGPAFIPGLELAGAFYREAVGPLIGDVPHAAALIGTGSDVLGFDTARSTDHGWGPRVQVFVDRGGRGGGRGPDRRGPAGHVPRLARALRLGARSPSSTT